MAGTKYGHLVKKLKFTEGSGRTKGTGGLNYVAKAAAVDLEGLPLCFEWGFASRTGEWKPEERGGHVHPDHECLLFVGLDYDRPDYLGAEVEIAMGKEGERHVFETPTLIVVPRGLRHCPVVARKAEKPYGFLLISLGGEYRVTGSPDIVAAPASPEKKYGDLVKKLEMRDAKRTKGGNADFIAGWNGKDMAGFDLNFTWAFHKGLGLWHEHDPHTHPAGEALLFVGLDPNRPDYLGAEIEIGMGEEQEKHVFDTPTVVIAPGGFVHCPLNTRRVDKPYGFSAISLSTGHETKWLG
jgi:hypothetical protein